MGSPVIVKGRVYLATFSNKLNVYGLLAPAPPPAPVNLTALGGNGLAALAWTAANRTASYTVRRSLVAGGPYTALQSGVTTTYFTDSTVSNGTTYYYVVSAVNTFGESANSAPAAATPDASANGNVIGFQFVGNGVALGSGDVAGVVPAANWNPCAGASGTIGQATDNFGLPAGASISWNSNNVWAIGLADSPGNPRLMNGYLDTTDTSTTTITVANIPAAFVRTGYDVYVYCDGDNTFTAGDYTLGGVTIQALDRSNFNGTFTLAANGAAGNYLVFPNQTASGFTLTAAASATNGGFRAPLNAIQIVSPRRTISGIITLEGAVNATQPITFAFRDFTTGAILLTKTQVLTAIAGTSNGTFTISNVPSGKYRLAIKGNINLQAVVTVNAQSGDVSDVSVTLPGGDADGNNTIDIADFGVLVNAYSGSLAVTGSGYDARADFNFDGVVDIGDFGILVNNYGSTGDL